MPGIGQPADRDFEITFADLAHAQLRDKAPQLLDYLLGFQVIDSNEDQTHGVGVLGFKIGEQMLFVPAFFLNGELKQNLIYIKNQDLFVPLQDNWVGYLLNRRPFIMGDPEGRKEQELGVMEPDLRALSNSQGSGSASIFGTRQASWQPWTTGVERMFEKLASRYGKLDTLPDFLKKTAAYGTVNTLLRTMQQDSNFGNSVLRFYKLAELMHKPAACSSGGSHSYTAKPKSKTKKRKLPPVMKRSSILFDIEKEAASSDDSLVRILHGPRAAEGRLMADADVARLMRGEILIKDAREKNNLAYEADGGTKLQNPTESGEHELLLTNGEYRDVFVFVAPKALGKGYARVCLIVDKETKDYGYWWNDALWCRPYEQSKTEFEKSIAALSDISSVQPNGTYVIVSPKGRSTIAFNVSRKDSGKDGQTELFVNTRVKDPGIKQYTLPEGMNDEDVTQFGEGPRLPYVGDVRNNTTRDDETEQDEDAKSFVNLNHIVITNDDRDVRVVGNTLFAPKTAKVLKVKDGNALESWAMSDPSSLIDVEANLLKSGAEQFTVLRKSGDYYVDNQGPFRRIDVVTALVKKAGLRGDSALTIVDTLRDDKRKRYLVKLAAPYAPPIPEHPMGFDEYVGIPEQYPQDDLVDAPSGLEQNPQAYLGKPERQQIMEAAEVGQQEIFDTSAISSLVRTSNSDDLIVQYLSDMILGLDRVNRLLFMYYWLNEQFRDRYGQENMIELEDQLKDVSKSLGDLVLFLKQRQVEGSPGFDSMEIDLGAQ